MHYEFKANFKPYVLLDHLNKSEGIREERERHWFINRCDLNGEHANENGEIL